MQIFNRVQENNSGFVQELPSGSLAKKYLTRYYDMFLKENVKLDQLLKAIRCDWGKK